MVAGKPENLARARYEMRIHVHDIRADCSGVVATSFDVGDRPQVRELEENSQKVLTTSLWTTEENQLGSLLHLSVTEHAYAACFSSVKPQLHCIAVNNVTIAIATPKPFTFGPRFSVRHLHNRAVCLASSLNHLFSDTMSNGY